MSLFIFFSSSSGVPLYSFSTLHTNDILFSSHIGSLNGSYVFSNCKSDLVICQGGNNLIEIHWEAFRFFNVISYSIETFVRPQLNDVILLVDILLSLFSSNATLNSTFSLTESSIRSVNRFTKILESFISPGKILSIGSGIITESYSFLHSSHDEFEFIFQSFFVCIRNHQNICVSSKNWDKITQHQQFIILNLIQNLQPFSLIDLPIYIHYLLSEPLRLYSIELSNSFQFIGLFGSDIQLETLNYTLRSFSCDLNRLAQPIYPLSSSLKEFGYLILGILIINSSSRTYSYNFNPNSIISDRLCLKMLLFRKYFLFSKADVQFNELTSPFNNNEKYRLVIKNTYITYKKLSVYIYSNSISTNILILSKIEPYFTRKLCIKLINFIHFNKNF